MRNLLLIRLFVFFILTITIHTSLPDIASASNVLSDVKLQNMQKELILKALDALKSKPKLTDKEEKELENYSQAQYFMEKYVAEQRLIEDIKTWDFTEPEAIRKLEKSIKETSPVLEDQFYKKSQRQPLNVLEKNLEEQKLALANQREKLLSLSDQVAKTRIRPENNQRQLVVNQTRLTDIYKQIQELKGENSTSSDEKKWVHLNSEGLFIEAQNERFNKEIQNNSSHLKLLTLENQLLSIDIKNNELKNQWLQSIINEKRKEASEALVADTDNTDETTTQTLVLQQLSSENNKLKQSLLEYTERINKLTNSSRNIKNQLNSLTTIRQSIEQQSSLFGKSVLLARTLRNSLLHLPNIIVDRKLSEEISETRLQKFQYDQQRQLLDTPDKFISNMVSEVQLTSTEYETVKNLSENRKKLLDSLSLNTGKLLTIALSLHLDQQRLDSLGKELSGKLEQELFWVTSSQPMGVNWLLNLPRLVWNEIVAMPWEKITYVSILSFLQKSWFIILITLMFCIYLYSRRPLIKKLQNNIAQKIGHIRQDSLLLTPLSLLLSLLYIAPVGLFMAIMALVFIEYNTFDTGLSNIGYSFFYSIITWSILALLIQLLQPGGLATKHFKWSVQYCQQLRQHLRKLSHLLVPLILIVNLAENQVRELDQDILGMLLLMIGTIIQARLIFMLFRDLKYLFGSKILHVLITILLSGISLIQTVLIATGYYYTALILEQQILGTLVLVTGFSLLQSLAIRSIRIGEHRLAYQRAVKKHAATENRSFEEPVLDLATVNQQSLRLLNAVLIFSFIISFFWLWKNFAEIFSAINNLSLWEYRGENSSTHLYLGNVILAVITMITTLILARNLPGLLEITVLSRLKIRAGNSYAAMTLLSYGITSLGVIFTLAFLGFSWDKLQWLVAAIGFGISIGLREVFANILSGLIILFERPIRIGDTISLGNMTGEVSQIHIRATTILDWDNKEVIIPNSMLLNEKMINWSLSNSIIRIILPFYVTHDSDKKLVEELLLQACREHHFVVDTPKSIATLMEYGDSALFYELRLFIMHVNHRLAVKNEINSRVSELFAEKGIVVAPQKRLLSFQ